jgi:hypothetical protein
MFSFTSTDRDECMLRKQDSKYKKMYPCSDEAVCQNIPGSYSCTCKKGKRDGKISECPPDNHNPINLFIGKNPLQTVQFCLIQGWRQKSSQGQIARTKYLQVPNKDIFLHEKISAK